MGNLVKVEWYKLIRDRSFWVITLFLLAFSVLYPLLLEGGKEISGNDFYRGYILSINTDIIKLFPAILAGFFIANEYSIGTMKSIASSGNSRISIYLAKLFVFSIGSVIILLILPIFMMGASAVYMGFNVMPEWSFYFQTIGLIALYAAAFASIMVLCSTILTDSGKAIGFLLLFLALISSFLDFLSSRVSFLEPIISHSIFMTQGSILAVDQIGHWDGGDVFTLIIIPILTFLVFGIIGNFIFQRKEIK